MFNSDNYSSDGVEYNYDTLNSILHENLNGSVDIDDIKNISDSINNKLYFRNDKIMYENTQVGIVL
jgi:hypothetical protein